MASQTVVKQGSSVVYQSLQQVVEALTTPHVTKTLPNVTQLLKIGQWSKILDEQNSPLPVKPRYPPSKENQAKMPFIVVEGLDGSGKTRVSTGLSERLNLQLMRTPPNFIKSYKKLFDDQNECLRRAYYSLGNYLAAAEVQYYCFSQGVIMDRYWHSTAAYALAHQMTMNGPESIPPSLFTWPEDLLKPDLVIFLVVSEETRRFRHAYRNTTNTKEEQTLAESPAFRQNLIDCYNKIVGPTLVQLDANNVSPTATVDENVEAIIDKAHKEILSKLSLTQFHEHSTTGKLSI